MMNKDAMNMIECAVLENDINKFHNTLDMTIFMNEVYMFQLDLDKINIDIIDNLRNRISTMIKLSDELFDLRNRGIVLESVELVSTCNDLKDLIQKHIQS